MHHFLRKIKENRFFDSPNTTKVPSEVQSTNTQGTYITSYLIEYTKHIGKENEVQEVQSSVCQ